ncbi:hypothetical protein C8N35_102389 [Breoghania corrubedonensis]|uniref:Uncharacterized protein n=1 Tax=Breoghania corrubedonensis TaxID=665038 RepID=A0A2T5VD57_9HYPH|nr:hypothetical protein [Breoghania corrubedonensis]PTW61674.1 hypothetical protein C8N35_102389 [Breoghania corrubedonensis]
MDDDEHLKALNEKRAVIEDEIGSIDLEIEHAEHGAIHTTEIGRRVDYLGERYRKLQELSFDLGKVTARIEDLQERIQIRCDLSHEAEAVDRWQRRPPSKEDNIDWVTAALENARAQRRAEQGPATPTREPRDERERQDDDRKEPERDR